MLAHITSQELPLLLVLLSAAVGVGIGVGATLVARRVFRRR